MSFDLLQRWCEPRLILMATNLDDQPALVCHTVAEARRSGARLLLVHVIPPPTARDEPGPPHLYRLPSTRAAADALEHMALHLQWQGVLCEPVVLKGRPDEQIEALVRSRNVDRVIVAARDNRRRGPSIRRSVADRLIAALQVPVCVVSGQVCPETLHEPTGGRVLLPLSLHSVRREYVDFACGIARARRSRLTMLHVIDPSSVTERQREYLHDASRLRLAALAATHEELLWRPDVAVREGDAAAEIVEEAACPVRDLIILGSSSLTANRQVSGVIERVIAASRCPVITLRSPASMATADPDATWSEQKTGSLN